jgi:hypothetical protein
MFLYRAVINRRIFDKICSNPFVSADVTLYKAIEVSLNKVVILLALLGRLQNVNPIMSECSGLFARIKLMANQPRVAKVLAALLVSMTAGSIVLMALGNNPPSAALWSLSHYVRLDSVEQVIHSRAVQSPDCWSSIEICYSGTKDGNIEQLASLAGLASPEDIKCHFVVCNGQGGSDGQIQSSEKWQRQSPVVPGRTSYGNGQTICICVIADPLKAGRPTDCQIKRLEALVEVLSRKFSIAAESVHFPSDWQ